MSNAELLKIVLDGVPAGNRRRQEVIEWGYLLGLSESEALQCARSANLIPSTHPPHRRRAKNLSIKIGKVLTNKLLV
jgi:hypothetical protein